MTSPFELLQGVVNLVRIDLRECQHWKNLPDLSKASKLNWVNLSGCESLRDIHPSIFSFDTLETLMLDGCKKLKGLKSGKHLTSLRKISVNGCTSLKEFSLSSDSIRSLDLSSTRIGMIDSTFERLTSLESLNVHGLRYGNIPDELFSLKDLQELKICNCRLAIDKQELGSLSKLPPFVTEFNAVNCWSLISVSSLNSSALNLKGKGKFISFKNCGWLDEPSLHCIMKASEATETYDENDCNDINTNHEPETYEESDCSDINNNHEPDLSEHCSCSCDYLFVLLGRSYELGTFDRVVSYEAVTG
ncbi:hypothetical protein JHK82_056995 [Glycine max]|nr:hypothetical protein JHK84_056889 [Glycine max]KAG5078300.1 hypothetical protein JHK82_056995 [Glycine max]